MIMKKNTLFLVASLIANSVVLNGADILFTNFDDQTFQGLVITDSSGSALDSTSTVALGYFSDESAVSLGDFSSFQSLDMGFFASIDTFNIDGLFYETYDAELSNDFIDQNITLFVTNGTGDEWLVAKSNLTYQADAPLFTASVNLFDDQDSITYLFGGQSGVDIDYGVGPMPSISTASVSAVVPEPSTYAAICGALMFLFVAYRRRLRK